MGEMITFDRAARKKILAGVQLLSKSLKGQAVICRKNGIVRTTNNWKVIAEAVHSHDLLEGMGIRIVRENAISAEAVHIVAELFKEGLEAYFNGMSLAQIKKEFEKREEKESRVTVVLSKGYLSPYFVTDPEKMECQFEKPYIYVSLNKLTTPLDVVPILEQHKGPLVIIAEEIRGDALTTLVINCVKQKLPIAAVQVSPQERMQLQSGIVEKVIIDKSSAAIVGTRGQNALANGISIASYLLAADTAFI